MKINVLRIFVVSILMLSTFATASPQNPKQIVQLATLDVDPAQLDAYKAALHEEVEIALRVERGVLRLEAMAEKENPAHITLVEVYADEAAYQAHLQTPHFLRYKTRTKEMVKSLQLARMVPLFPELKQK